MKVWDLNCLGERNPTIVKNKTALSWVFINKWIKNFGHTSEPPIYDVGLRKVTIEQDIVDHMNKKGDPYFIAPKIKRRMAQQDLTVSRHTIIKIKRFGYKWKGTQRLKKKITSL